MLKTNLASKRVSILPILEAELAAEAKAREIVKRQEEKRQEILETLPEYHILDWSGHYRQDQ